MTNEENSLGWKNPFVFCSSPRSLLSIATSNVALLCWRHQLEFVLSKEAKFANKDWFSDYKFSSSDILRIPRPIETLIDCQIEFMGHELRQWWLDHTGYFGDDDYQQISKWIDDIIFDSGGKISYEITARNLLKTDKYNLVEKYKIACKYCFENDILQLWPSISHLSFPDLPMLNFWNRRMQNEPARISGNGNISHELNSLMRNRNRTIITRAQVEYFWNKLNVDKQTSLAISFLFGSERGVVSYLLPKLNEAQLRNTLQIIPSKIIYALAKDNNEGCEYILFVWNYTKHSIHKLEFYYLIRHLLELTYFAEKNIADDVQFLLYDIWIDARDNLQKYILKHHVEHVIRNLSRRSYRDNTKSGYDCDLRFLFDLWARAKSELKFKLLQNPDICDLFFIIKASRLNEFMKLSFDDNRISSQFKQRFIKNMDVNFVRFIEKGLCDELIEYLKYFCDDDEEHVRNVMQRIAIMGFSSIFLLESRLWIKFNKFIDRAFLSASLAQQFKMKLIERNFDSYELNLDRGMNLRELRNSIDCLMSSDLDRLNKLKRRCHQRCQNNMTNNKFKLDFNEPSWKEFLKWCSL